MIVVLVPPRGLGLNGNTLIGFVQKPQNSGYEASKKPKQQRPENLALRSRPLHSPLHR